MSSRDSLLPPGAAKSARALVNPRCVYCGHALCVRTDEHERPAERDLAYDQLPDEELLWLGRS